MQVTVDAYGHHAQEAPRVPADADASTDAVSSDRRLHIASSEGQLDGSQIHSSSMIVASANDQTAISHTLKLALAERRLSAQLPVSFLLDVMKRQEACIGFMKALSAHLQPVSAKNEACNLAFAHSSFDAAGSGRPQDLLAEDLGELTSDARAAVSAILSCCQKATANLEAGISCRDQQISQVQHEANQHAAEAVKRFKALQAEHQAQETELKELLDKAQKERTDLQRAVTELDSRCGEGRNQIAALQKALALTAPAIREQAGHAQQVSNEPAEAACIGLEQPLDSRTVSQLLQAASRCRELEKQRMMLEQELAAVQQRCEHEVQLAVASEHQAKAQKHSLERDVQALASEHQQQQAASHHEVAELWGTYAASQSDHKQQALASEERLQQLMAELNAGVSNQQRLRADLVASHEAQHLSNLEKDKLVSQHEEQVKALDQQIVELQGKLGDLQVRQEQHDVASTQAQHQLRADLKAKTEQQEHLQADLEASNAVQQQLKLQLKSAEAESQQLISADGRLAASLHPLEIAIEQCSHLSSVLQDQQSTHNTSSGRAAQLLQAAENRCRELESEVEKQQLLDEQHSKMAAVNLQPAEDRCRHLQCEIEDLGAHHQADADQFNALQASEDHCTQLDAELEAAQADHAREADAAAAASQAAERKCGRLAQELEAAQAGHAREAAIAAAASQATADYCMQLTQELEALQACRAEEADAAAAALQRASERCKQLELELAELNASAPQEADMAAAISQNAEGTAMAGSQPAEDNCGRLQLQHNACQDALQVAECMVICSWKSPVTGGDGCPAETNGLPVVPAGHAILAAQLNDLQLECADLRAQLGAAKGKLAASSANCDGSQSPSAGQMPIRLQPANQQCEAPCHVQVSVDRCRWEFQSMSSPGVSSCISPCHSTPII